LGEFDRGKRANSNESTRERLVPTNRNILIYVPARKTAAQSGTAGVPQ
jgi:hypothetical protein